MTLCWLLLIPDGKIDLPVLSTFKKNLVWDSFSWAQHKRLAEIEKEVLNFFFFLKLSLTQYFVKTNYVPKG